MGSGQSRWYDEQEDLFWASYEGKKLQEQIDEHNEIRGEWNECLARSRRMLVFNLNLEQLKFALALDADAVEATTWQTQASCELISKDMLEKLKGIL